MASDDSLVKRQSLVLNPSAVSAILRANSKADTKLLSLSSSTTLSNY